MSTLFPSVESEARVFGRYMCASTEGAASAQASLAAERNAQKESAAYGDGQMMIGLGRTHSSVMRDSIARRAAEAQRLFGAATRYGKHEGLSMMALLNDRRFFAGTGTCLAGSGSGHVRGENENQTSSDSESESNLDSVSILRERGEAQNYAFASAQDPANADRTEDITEAEICFPCLHFLRLVHIPQVEYA